MKKKIWIRLFIRITAIFAAFVLILTLANSTLLFNYFLMNEKKALVNTAKTIENLDFSDSDAVTSLLTNSEDQINFVVEIFDDSGSTLYTTYNQQIWKIPDRPEMFRPDSKRKYRILESEPYKDGIISTVVDDGTNTEYLMYSVTYPNGNTAEIRVGKQILENSADIASRFVLIIATICLAVSLVWVIFFAKSFSKPIAEMNATARDMADLNFERKLTPKSEDEIGQLAVSINELSEKLDATLGDLRKSNAQLRNEIELERQIDSMRKGFVANVSHELKTPISIIQGYAEGLKLGVSDDPGAYCDVIIEESQRMNRLVLGLLELSRYESGQMVLEKETFDLVEICGSLCRKVERKAAENSVSISCDFPNSAMVSANADKVEQVLQNYIGNAISHVNKSGRITVKIRETENGFKTEVTNTGSHIPEDETEQIWQSFYRGDHSRKRDESRFGLGLSIVRSIMELHGKEYGVYNTENGVCFWFELDKAELPDDGKV